MPQISIHHFENELGHFIAGAYQGKLCLLDYRYRKMRARVDARIRKGLGAGFVEQNEAVIAQTQEQLAEYLQGRRTHFDIPLLLVGTPFQKRVWQALQQIPFGATLSYQQLAQTIGRASAVRAVATANGANAIAILVPCHRVIGSNSSLTGYAGGLRVKERLLELEGAAASAALPGE